MAKERNASPGQLSLFDLPPQEQEQILEIAQSAEALASQKASPLTFSRSERSYLGAWFAAMAFALAGPIGVPPNYGSDEGDTGLDSLVLAQQGDVVMERMIRLMGLLREEREELAGITEQAELEQAYQRMVKRVKREAYRLTDREVCMVMMGASLKAPLSRWAYAEYWRAFVSSYGPERAAALFGGDPAPVEWDSLCELRYFDIKLALRFPRVSQEEVEGLNAQLAQFRAI